MIVTKPRQLTLGLPHRAAMGREDFLVGAANAAAFSAVEAWPDWPYGMLLVVGPEGSGKTHLAEIWRGVAGAARADAARLQAADVPGLADHDALVVEDCGAGLDERALFHLVNEMERQGHSLLLTGRSEPATWRLALKDLASRLSRVPVVTMDLPDDALIEALLVKLFSDRQVAVEPGLLRYLVPRLERSFAFVNRIVSRLDETAIEEQRPVTRSLAARILREEQAA